MQINREQFHNAIDLGADKIAPVLAKAGPGAVKAAALGRSASRLTVRVLNAGIARAPLGWAALAQGSSALSGISESARELRQMPIAGRLSAARILPAGGVGALILLAAGRLMRRLLRPARQEPAEVST